MNASTVSRKQLESMLAKVGLKIKSPQYERTWELSGVVNGVYHNIIIERTDDGEHFTITRWLDAVCSKIEEQRSMTSLGVKSKKQAA